MTIRQNIFRQIFEVTVRQNFPHQNFALYSIHPMQTACLKRLNEGMLILSDLELPALPYN